MDVRYMAEVAFGGPISDEDFEKASVKAQNKQARIFKATGREEVKRTEYLAQLISEAIVECEFMKFALECGKVMNG